MRNAERGALNAEQAGAGAVGPPATAAPRRPERAARGRAAATPGECIGSLTAAARVGIDPSGGERWRWLCSCGREFNERVWLVRRWLARTGGAACRLCWLAPTFRRLNALIAAGVQPRSPDRRSSAKRSIHR